MAGHKRDRGASTAMGNRNTRISRSRDPSRYPWHHLYRNVALSQIGSLFTTATEQKRVTPLQANHSVVFKSHLDKHGVGAGLRHGMVAPAFAHKPPFTCVWNQIQHLGRHQ